MRVLIVDDDRELAEALAGFVRECKHEVVATVTGGGLPTIRSFARHQPDVVILDVMMPKFNGFMVCQQLLSRDPRVKVVLISGSVGSDYPSFATCKA
ncbi:MAG: response regulator, partial [Verrucomicrobiota bacterium]|nr:response regulator [Verrucomicrobiota bacterium]